MSDLSKISKILALKRSKCEIRVTAITARLGVLEADIRKNCRLLSESSLKLNACTDQELVDQLILLEQWKMLINKKIFDIRAQRADLRIEERSYKNNLKEIIVKEDLINRRLEGHKLQERKTMLEAADENRLQNWVLFR